MPHNIQAAGIATAMVQIRVTAGPNTGSTTPLPASGGDTTTAGALAATVDSGIRTGTASTAPTR